MTEPWECSESGVLDFGGWWRIFGGDGGDIVTNIGGVSGVLLSPCRIYL